MASYSNDTPAMPAESSLLVSKRDAAKLLSVCERTIDNLRTAANLPCRRIGRRVLFSPDELRAWFSQRLSAETSFSMSL